MNKTENLLLFVFKNTFRVFIFSVEIFSEFVWLSYKILRLRNLQSGEKIYFLLIEKFCIGGRDRNIAGGGGEM
jgi:hypothetical protein